MDAFKYDWIWIKNKPTGHVHAKNRPMKKHEIISVFSKGNTLHKGQSSKRMQYFPQGLLRLDTPILHRADHSSEVVMGKRPSHKDNLQEFTNYPNSLLHFNGVSQGEHPTQKPVPLLEYLVRTYTNPGDIVLDFAMGSGTTGVACANLGREFIGIEKEPVYFEIAKRRIAHAQSSTPEQTSLDLDSGA